ncbi:hypothetical protein E4U19_002464 [Claviceps sp. Clav32 group G5]|nr:hypothetical protein E4U19_002464 [Claviceps sp. Clav32 group G5]KAG6050454.1 hypothetical protein E4U39_004103 [Claviceps sp. Clav50 group G5]
MRFMAMEVLRKTTHAYRHDLKSFFRAFLWICARQACSNGPTGEDESPKESLFRKWEIGSFEYIEATKAGHMTVDGLEHHERVPKGIKCRKAALPENQDYVYACGQGRKNAFWNSWWRVCQLHKSIIAAYDEIMSLEG